MTEVFADTAFWIAASIPGDKWAAAAERAERALPAGATIVTTDEVLTEFLAWIAIRRGPLRRFRRPAVRYVRGILNNPNVIVVEQTHQAFLAGLDLYERRPDRDYSLVDCISMSVMRERGIREALTSDRHFEQEGFAALMLGAAAPPAAGSGSPPA